MKDHKHSEAEHEDSAAKAEPVETEAEPIETESEPVRAIHAGLSGPHTLEGDSRLRPLTHGLPLRNGHGTRPLTLCPLTNGYGRAHSRTGMGRDMQVRLGQASRWSRRSG